MTAVLPARFQCPDGFIIIREYPQKSELSVTIPKLGKFQATEQRTFWREPNGDIAIGAGTRRRGGTSRATQYEQTEQKAVHYIQCTYSYSISYLSYVSSISITLGEAPKFFGDKHKGGSVITGVVTRGVTTQVIRVTFSVVKVHKDRVKSPANHTLEEEESW